MKNLLRTKNLDCNTNKYLPNRIIIIVLSGLILLGFITCNTDDNGAVYDPTLYSLDYTDFPDPDIPSDNIPTKTGVQLGRMLFYEKQLSKDGTQACVDCHR
ncbi:MAG: cytochrome c peroxidase, partial [Saprospiraceae bacterium]